MLPLRAFLRFLRNKGHETRKKEIYAELIILST